MIDDNKTEDTSPIAPSTGYVGPARFAYAHQLEDGTVVATTRKLADATEVMIVPIARWRELRALEPSYTDKIFNRRYSEKLSEGGETKSLPAPVVCPKCKSHAQVFTDRTGSFGCWRVGCGIQLRGPEHNIEAEPRAQQNNESKVK